MWENNILKTEVRAIKAIYNKGTRRTIEIKNQTEERAELYIYGDIVYDKGWWNRDSDRDPSEIAEELAGIDQYEQLDIFINSGGGNVYAGMAIYNILKRHEGHKVVHVDGIAASIASVIAMAADELVIPKTAQLMLHKPWSYAVGNANDLRKEAEVLDSCEEMILNAYMEKATVDRDEIQRLVEEETWLTGEEAADYFEIRIEESDPQDCESRYFENYAHVPRTLKQDPAQAATIKLEPAALAEALKDQPEIIAEIAASLDKARGQKILEDLDYI